MLRFVLLTLLVSGCGQSPDRVASGQATYLSQQRPISRTQEASNRLPLIRENSGRADTAFGISRAQTMSFQSGTPDSTRQPPARQWKPPIPSDGYDLLAAARRTRYRKRRLLNKNEQQVFWVVLKLLKGDYRGMYHVCPQVSLGELLQWDNTDPAATKAVNSKRVDFCITDREFNPVLIIEVNGGGHFQSNWQERDEIKQIAARAAGIQYVSLDFRDGRLQNKDVLTTELTAILREVLVKQQASE